VLELSKYLIRSLARTHELSWFICQTVRTAVVKRERLKTKAYLRTANYLRPHDGGGGFRMAAQVPLETESLSEVSDDMRELIEQEWPELVRKLPPKVP
jgi:hypothetical protein